MNQNYLQEKQQLISKYEGEKDAKLLVKLIPTISRFDASVRIQKWVRGHLERVHYRKMQLNFRHMRKLRRILALRYYKIRSKLISQLITALKAVHENQKTQEDEIYQKYLNHCVTMI